MKTDRVSNVETAYRSLLGRIAAGELLPGAFLVEAELAADIGVSRTPVREAIRRLASEGLVHVEGRRRAVVRQVAEADADELFELRARLEGYAAYRAATRFDPAALRELASLCEGMETAARSAQRKSANDSEIAASAAEFATLNDRFHAMILAAAQADHLAAALRPILQVQLVLLRRYRERLAEHLERSCWHHRELVRAFERRDPELAEAQMRLHLLSARGA
jgi:DNA-binding GntR family transcriptional regulator